MVQMNRAIESDEKTASVEGMWKRSERQTVADANRGRSDRRADGVSGMMRTMACVATMTSERGRGDHHLAEGGRRHAHAQSRGSVVLCSGLADRQ